MAATPIRTPESPQAEWVEHRANQPLRMSYEEFLSWSDQGVHAEWVNGEVIVQMPPKYEHQQMVTFLVQLIGLFARWFKLGELLSAPFEMRATPDGPAREPDLLFVANEHLSRLTRERLSGPADLVIEVVSDESVYRDRVDKFEEYETTGVTEYWIVDPRPGKQRVDFWVLDENGRYQAGQVQEGTFYSKVIAGFWLRVEWLSAESLPEPLGLLAQIADLEKITSIMRQEPST